jgi:mono/diheme cytochrome c family protein
MTAVVQKGIALLVSLAALMAAPPAQAADGNPGRAAYFQYCSACHGADGRGDGVVAQKMCPKPTDLTHLAARHGGSFPDEAVRASIDGRSAIAAHGTRRMPVWGRVFAQEHTPEQREAHVRSQVQIIVDHLRSIQMP